MANILILTQFFPPETNPGARRISAMAAALSKKNNVVVLTPQPSYPEATLFDPLAVNACDQEFAGCIIRGNVFRPHHPSLLIRAFGEARMALCLFWKAAFIHMDLVVVSTPSVFLAPFAWLLARWKGVNFVYDLRDLTWRYARETATSNRLNLLLSRVLEKLMISILHHSDLVICATPGIAEILVTQHMLSPEKIITIMNGVSDDILAAGQQACSSREIAQPVVTYIGLFGHNHGIEVFLDVAKLLPAITFLLIGDGPDKKNLIGRISAEKIGNVIVPGYVTSLEELAAYYHQSTILMSHIKNAPVMRSTAIPAKIFEYMAFGKPIIYAGEGVAVGFLENIGCAVTIPPDNPAAIAQAISELLKDAPKMRIMGERGKEYVEKYYRRNELMLQLEHEFDRRFNMNASRQTSFMIGRG